MNQRKFDAAMEGLEQLHWHLNRSGGPDLWTAQLLRQFRDAANDRAEPQTDVLFVEEAQ